MKINKSQQMKKIVLVHETDLKTFNLKCQELYSENYYPEIAPQFIVGSGYMQQFLFQPEIEYDPDPFAGMKFERPKPMMQKIAEKFIPIIIEFLKENSEEEKKK